MKKITTIVAGTVLPLLVAIFISSCQKNNRDIEANQKLNEENLSSERKHGHHHHHDWKKFKGTFDTYYNFIPDIAGGWTPPNPAPAWYPGGGNGQLIQTGTFKTFFNQYATLGPSGLQTVAAPVNMFFAAPLGAAGYTVPNTVTTIFYNNNGKSIWCKGTGASIATPVSPTRIEFTAALNIIGGTRNFNGAHGDFTLKGFFNPQNSQDAGFKVDGRVCY